MKEKNIILKDQKRYTTPYNISRSKLISAAEKAIDKLLACYKTRGFGYPGTYSVDYKYKISDITNWESGMYTGCFWLAYELTGEKEFKSIALSHIKSYKNNIDQKENINDHDVGFMYSPSVVAAYKLTGDDTYRDIALRTAEYYYNKSYSEEGKFIIRYVDAWDEGWGCRTMMDSLMNAPFLFWAANESGNSKYYDAAMNQQRTTERLLIRDDGSSFHHYQFDPVTSKPLYGLTFQGNADNSCWSRGHAWGVYGFPIAYAYTGDSDIRNTHKLITNFWLNNLPTDAMPYWDFDFCEPSDAPKDSSAGVISACGLLEMSRLIEDTASEKLVYQNAAAMMLDSVIDNCTGDIGVEYDGLIHHVTSALPQGYGINECAVYGDYFYLEALMRFINPDWKMYW